MNLSDGAGTTLSLSVSGYQFPAIQTEFDDSNWLNVAGKIQHPLGGWSFREACLLTYELARLCTWLDAVAETPDAEHEAEYFTEPCLEFHIVRASGKLVLRVHLSHEACPPWVTNRGDRSDGVDLDFPVENNDLGATAASLRELLERYPQRAER